MAAGKPTAESQLLKAGSCRRPGVQLCHQVVGQLLHYDFYLGHVPVWGVSLRVKCWKQSRGAGVGKNVTVRRWGHEVVYVTLGIRHQSGSRSGQL